MSEAPNALLDFIDRYGPPAGEQGPLRFVEEVLGATPDDWQREVLLAFGRGERRISVRSCHGVGKTALAAWLCVYMLLGRFPQKTVATAPTAGQLSGALVPEIKTWCKRLPEALFEVLEIKAQSIHLKAAPDESYFEARTSRAEKPEALQGIHSDHVLLIADEASGVPEQVFEAAAGSMSGHNATTLLIGNPVRTQGFFFDTHHKLRDMWFTRKVSHSDSARVTDDFVEDISRRYGADSNAFRVRCLGEFPRSDEDVLIPFETVESARQRDIVSVPGVARVWGLDVARFGGDRNALLKRTNREVLPDIQVWDGVDLMSTAGRVKAEWDDTPENLRPRTVLVDVIGLGAGVVDRLRELGLPVRGINVAESAAATERFANSRSELWWKTREWLSKHDVKLPQAKPGADLRVDPAEVLATELVTPKYEFSSTGKIAVESKKDMKKRGYKSPDVADALVLTFAEELATLIGGSAAGSSWDEPIKRGLPVV